MKQLPVRPPRLVSLAGRTDEPLRPPHLNQVIDAVLFYLELRFKFHQRRRILSHPRTLHVGVT
jgi:hypothetical protein